MGLQWRLNEAKKLSVTSYIQQMEQSLRRFSNSDVERSWRKQTTRNWAQTQTYYKSFNQKHVVYFLYQSIMFWDKPVRDSSTQSSPSLHRNTFHLVPLVVIVTNLVSRWTVTLTHFWIRIQHCNMECKHTKWYLTLTFWIENKQLPCRHFRELWHLIVGFMSNHHG